MQNDYAYFKVIQTFCKARWINRPLLDVIVSEYSSRSPQYYHDAILAGCILINNKETTPDYIIKEHDKLLHIIHCHEPRQPDVVYNNRIIRTKECLHNTESSHQPVTSNYIEIIAIENDFIVVCKPPGLVSHPNPNCLYYTLTKTLEPIFGSLSCTNRLDVPTSGIVIVSKTNRLHELMKEKKIQKTYVALVNGKFEDQIVDKPIKKVYGKGNVVSEDGKECLTHFKCLEYNGTYSLVECKPITGRTHQIRVHLQSVGYPIVNDKMYNGEIIEPNVVILKAQCDGVNDGAEDMNLDGVCISEKARQFAYKNCEYKGNDVYKNKDSYLCLHAYKYKIDEKEYTAKMPEWTKLSK